MDIVNQFLPVLFKGEHNMVIKILLYSPRRPILWATWGGWYYARIGIRSSLEEFTLLRRVFVINTLLSLFFGRKTLPSFSKFSFSAYLCNQSSVVAINSAAHFISATIKLDSLYFHQGTVLVSYENARNPSKCRKFSVLLYI